MKHYRAAIVTSLVLALIVIGLRLRHQWINAHTHHHYPNDVERRALWEKGLRDKP